MIENSNSMCWKISIKFHIKCLNAFPFRENGISLPEKRKKKKHKTLGIEISNCFNTRSENLRSFARETLQIIRKRVDINFS